MSDIVFQRAVNLVPDVMLMSCLVKTLMSTLYLTTEEWGESRMLIEDVYTKFTKKVKITLLIQKNKETPTQQFTKLLSLLTESTFHFSFITFFVTSQGHESF